MNNKQKLTAQSIFNTVSLHLLIQNQIAADKHISLSGFEELRCRYRGPNNTKCAFGILISDGEYHSEMEDKSASTLLDAYARTYPSLQRFKPFYGLIARLQLIHDLDHAYYWPTKLYETAKEFKLEWPYGVGNK